MNGERAGRWRRGALGHGGNGTAAGLGGGEFAIDQSASCPGNGIALVSTMGLLDLTLGPSTALGIPPGLAAVGLALSAAFLARPPVLLGFGLRCGRGGAVVRLLGPIFFLGSAAAGLDAQSTQPMSVKCSPSASQAAPPRAGRMAGGAAPAGRYCCAEATA